MNRLMLSELPLSEQVAIQLEADAKLEARVRDFLNPLDSLLANASPHPLAVVADSGESNPLSMEQIA